MNLVIFQFYLSYFFISSLNKENFELVKLCSIKKSTNCNHKINFIICQIVSTDNTWTNINRSDLKDLWDSNCTGSKWTSLHTLTGYTSKMQRGSIPFNKMKYMNSIISSVFPSIAAEKTFAS